MKVLIPLSTVLLSGSHLDVLWGNLLIVGLVSILFYVLFSVTMHTHLSIHGGWPWDCPHPKHTLLRQSLVTIASPAVLGTWNHLGTYWMVHLKILTQRATSYYIWSKMLGWPAKTFAQGFKTWIPFWSTQFKVNWINSFISYSDANSIIQNLL